MTMEEKIKEIGRRIGSSDNKSISASDNLNELRKSSKKPVSRDELDASARKIRKSIERYSRELERYS